MTGYVVPSKAAGDTFTAGDYERYLRSNFNSSVPGIMTAKGDIAAGSAIRQSGALAAGDDYTALQANSANAVGGDYSNAIGISIWSFLYNQYPAESGQNYVIDFILDGTTSNKVIYQSHTFFEPSATLSKFIIPEGLGGVYIIDITILSFFQTHPGCYVDINIGGSISYTSTQYFPSDTTYPGLFSFYPHAQTIAQLDAGDYLEFTVTQTGATSCILKQPLVSIYKLR